MIAFRTRQRRLQHRVLHPASAQVIPNRSRDQAQQAAVKRGKRKLPVEVICEIGAAKRADDERRKVAVLSKRKGQPRESEKGKSLEDVEDDTFVLSERSQSRRRPNSSEERETTRRSESRD